MLINLFLPVNCSQDCKESDLQPCIEDKQECQTTESHIEKCKKYDKYSFYDIFVQTVSNHVCKQPSNKEYFKPSGVIKK